LILKEKRPMSAELDKTPGPFRHAESFTCKVHIAGDGRAVPIPPGPPQEKWMKLGTVDEEGVTLTRWGRVCRDSWLTTRLAAAGRVIAGMLHIKAPDKPEG
jgi:hypothetical protein